MMGAVFLLQGGLEGGYTLGIFIFYLRSMSEKFGESFGGLGEVQEEVEKIEHQKAGATSPEQVQSQPSESREGMLKKKRLSLPDRSDVAYKKWREENPNGDIEVRANEMAKADEKIFLEWSKGCAEDLLEGNEVSFSPDEITALALSMGASRPGISPEKAEAFFEAFPDVRRRIAAQKILWEEWPQKKISWS